MVKVGVFGLNNGMDMGLTHAGVEFGLSGLGSDVHHWVGGGSENVLWELKLFRVLGIKF